MNNLKLLRKQKGMTQQEISDLLSVTRPTYSRYESGAVEPSQETWEKLADFFNVSIGYLMGKEEKQTTKKDASDGNLPPLTPKDERDIARELERILNGLDDKNTMAAMGGTVDDAEDRELLKSSIEYSLRLARQLAKKKFTPKKYRKDEE